MEIYGSEHLKINGNQESLYIIVEKFGTAATKSYLKVNVLRYQPKIWHKTCSADWLWFLEDLEVNMFCKIYILYKI